MKRIHLLFLLGLASLSAYSQTMKLDFPQFAGQDWMFGIYQGNQVDTIVKASLDAQGKAHIVLPEKYKNYRGMSKWALAQGGGLDVIFAGGENFSVSCPDANPSADNIRYENTAENTFLTQQYHRQQDVFAKIDAMRMASQAYKGDSKFLPIFEQELTSLEQQFESLQTEMAESPLYAARFRQITDFMQGIGRQLPKSEEENAKQLARFAATELNLDALYTSNHWTDALDSWMSMHINVLKNDSLLLADTKAMLQSCQSDKVYTAFSERIVSLFSKHAKDDLLADLAVDMKQSGRLQNPGSFLKHITVAQKGDVAPQLTQISLPKSQTLLVFYESGCGPCENEMQQLKGNYPLLQEKGIELISFSADTDEAIFKNTSNDFPWKDKLCDLKGFKSPDFQNYGVIGTPTYYLIDDKGIIQGRYARLADTGLLDIEK